MTPRTFNDGTKGDGWELQPSFGAKKATVMLASLKLSQRRPPFSLPSLSMKCLLWCGFWSLNSCPNKLTAKSLTTWHRDVMKYKEERIVDKQRQKHQRSKVKEEDECVMRLVLSWPSWVFKFGTKFDKVIHKSKSAYCYQVIRFKLQLESNTQNLLLTNWYTLNGSNSGLYSAAQNLSSCYPIPFSLLITLIFDCMIVTLLFLIIISYNHEHEHNLNLILEASPKCKCFFKVFIWIGFCGYDH